MFRVFALAIALMLSTTAQAQVSRDSLCLSYFTAIRARLHPSESDALSQSGACSSAAVRLRFWLVEARRSAFNKEEEARRKLAAVQSTRDQTTSVPGDAVNAIEPVETAAGSVGAVGTESGSSAIAAIAINPAFFLVSPSDIKGVAKWSRFTDLSLLVPASDADKDQDGDVDYIGIRWRINITGLSAGDSLVAAVGNAFERILDGGSAERAAITAALTQVNDSILESCMESIAQAGEVGRSPDELSASFKKAASACGDASFLLEESIPLYQQFDESIRAARIAADRRYFGLDLRGDFGDLRRFGVDTLSGRSITVSLGYGRRFAFLDSRASNGLRTNLGVKYFEANGASNARFAATGGVAYELIRYYEDQRLSFTAGIDFEADNKKAASAEAGPDFLALRTSLNVPLAGATSMTVTFGKPIVGAKTAGPMLSVKANWRLLWAK